MIFFKLELFSFIYKFFLVFSSESSLVTSESHSVMIILLTPLLLLRNNVKLIRINYGYNSYGSLSTMNQVLEISFIIVIMI